MLEFVNSARIMLEEVVKIRPGQKLLVITDTHARSKVLAHTVAEVANSIGIETVLTMMAPVANVGQEPPSCISAAMKEVDVTLEFVEGYNLIHSTARKEAATLGVKHFVLNTDASEDYLRTPIPSEDLTRIGTQTEKLAEIMTRANSILESMSSCLVNGLARHRPLRCATRRWQRDLSPLVLKSSSQQKSLKYLRPSDVSFG